MGTIFGKPNLPPAPEPPKREDTAREAALQRRLAQLAKGRSDDILTSPSGVDAPARLKTKLGE